MNLEVKVTHFLSSKVVFLLMETVLCWRLFLMQIRWWEVMLGCMTMV